MSVSAQKHDSEKVRLDLLPFAAVEEVGRVFTYGARKYGSYGSCSCSVGTITTVERSPRGSVAPATTRLGSVPTQPHEPVRTSDSGPSGLRTENDSTPTTASAIDDLDNARGAERRGTGSQSNRCEPCSHRDAVSARLENTFGSTTATRQAAFAERSVTVATSGLGGLKTAEIGSVQHAPTCGALRFTDGSHNFRKGMAWGRLLGAALRHLFAWARGQRSDPESGELHLAHAACCILMLLDAELHGIGTDDRWRLEKKDAAIVESEQCGDTNPLGFVCQRGRDHVGRHESGRVDWEIRR